MVQLFSKEKVYSDCQLRERSSLPPKRQAYLVCQLRERVDLFSSIRYTQVVICEKVVVVLKEEGILRLPSAEGGSCS